MSSAVRLYRMSASVRLLTLCVVAILAGRSFAADKVWNGPATGGKFSQGPWSPSGAPTSSDTLVFSSATTEVENDLTNADGSDLTVAGITHSDSASLSISGKGLQVGSGGVQNKSGSPLKFLVPVQVNNLVTCAPSINNAWTGIFYKNGLTGVGYKVGQGGYTYIQEVPCALTGSFFQDAYVDTVYYGVSSNTASTFYFYNGSTADCQVKDAFAAPVSIGNANSQNFNGIIKLNGFNQTAITKFSTIKRNGGTTEMYFPRIQSNAKAQIVLQGDQQYDGGVMRFLLQDKAGFCWNPSDDKTVILSNETQTTQGDLGVLNGTMKLVGGATFTQMDTLTVGATGTFVVEAGSGAGFCAKKLVLQEGGSLVLGKGVAITVDAATLGATPLTAGRSYCGVDGPSGMTRLGNISGCGYVTVKIPSEPTATAQWDAGAGADTSIGTAANWQGDAVPDLASGGALVQFAAGSAVLVDRDVRLNGLAVTTPPGDFAINGSGSYGLTLYGKGIDIAEGTSARSITVSAPLDIQQSQTWKLSGANDTLSVTGGLLAGLPSAVTTLSGFGTIGLEGVSAYAGELKVSQSGSTDASRFVLANADIAGPLSIQTASTMFRDSYSSSDESGASSRQSIVRGKTTLNASITLRFRGRMTFAGGLTLEAMVYPRGDGRYVITNAPITSTQTRTWLSDQATTTELWAEDNWVNLTLYNGARGYCNVPQALKGRGNLTLGTGAFDIDRRGWLYLTGDQSVLNFTTYVARQGSRGEEISSEGLATLTTSDATDRDHYVIFKGGASYRQTGTGHAHFFKSSTSTGNVEVVSGTLTFENATNGLYHCAVGNVDHQIASEGGSWVNAARVTVGGGASAAKVRILHTKTFGSETEVEIAQNGELHLADGVVERVGKLIVDGKPMPGGTWGSPESAAFNKSAKFSGKGVLRVKGGGIVIVVR